MTYQIRNESLCWNNPEMIPETGFPVEKQVRANLGFVTIELHLMHLNSDKDCSQYKKIYGM